MSTNEFRFDASQILQPAQPSPLNRTAPVKFGASLTIAAGQAVGRKTSDSAMYPLNPIATDGTQIFAGFNHMALATDASNKVYYTFGGTSGAPSVFSPAGMMSDIYTGGIFHPDDIVTAATGTPIAEVDTITPTSPTTGDIYTVSTPSGVEASFTVGATQTAAATVTGLTNAWNADPILKALATASGSTTFILTATTKGEPLNLTASAVGTGTTALVITTPAVSAQQGEVDTFTATNPTTGDVYTITINYPNGTTHAVSATVGSTQTATAIDTLLIAAWNADSVAAAYATATGTTTFILTAVVPGSAMNVTGAVVGTGTVAKVVTKTALGKNINDILSGAPGARILQPTGYWEIP